jgi:hypothetical protein
MHARLYLNFIRGRRRRLSSSSAAAASAAAAASDERRKVVGRDEVPVLRLDVAA